MWRFSQPKNGPTVEMRLPIHLVGNLRQKSRSRCSRHWCFYFVPLRKCEYVSRSDDIAPDLVIIVLRTCVMYCTVAIDGTVVV